MGMVIFVVFGIFVNLHCTTSASTKKPLNIGYYTHEIKCPSCNAGYEPFPKCRVDLQEDYRSLDPKNIKCVPCEEGYYQERYNSFFACTKCVPGVSDSNPEVNKQCKHTKKPEVRGYEAASGTFIPCCPYGGGTPTWTYQHVKECLSDYCTCPYSPGNEHEIQGHLQKLQKHGLFLGQKVPRCSNKTTHIPQPPTETKDIPSTNKMSTKSLVLLVTFLLAGIASVVCIVVICKRYDVCRKIHFNEDPIQDVAEEVQPGILETRPLMSETFDIWSSNFTRNDDSGNNSVIETNIDVAERRADQGPLRNITRIDLRDSDNNAIDSAIGTAQCTAANSDVGSPVVLNKIYNVTTVTFNTLLSAAALITTAISPRSSTPLQSGLDKLYPELNDEKKRDKLIHDCAEANEKCPEFYRDMKLFDSPYGKMNIWVVEILFENNVELMLHLLKRFVQVFHQKNVAFEVGKLHEVKEQLPSYFTTVLAEHCKYPAFFCWLDWEGLGHIKEQVIDKLRSTIPQNSIENINSSHAHEVD